MIGWFAMIALARLLLHATLSNQIRTFNFVSALALSILILGFPLELHSAWKVDQSAAEDEIERLLALEDDELLHAVQEQTFRYFWDFAHPLSGMIRERNTSGDLVTTGGSGFGVMAILVGIHRGFISYEDGLARINKVVDFLTNADRFHGAWPHWMNGVTGKVIPFSPRDDGGDLVETAFMLEGLLTARSFFDASTVEQQQLRMKITELWEAVEWNWYRKQVQQNLFWHWSPNVGFELNLAIRGWNEAMIAYVLGVASPTHPLPVSTFAKGWAGGAYANGQTYYGLKLELGRGSGGPLFFTHYSFLGLDPREMKDDYANYFFQGQNQTLINRAYCIENPENHAGYGPNCWGLTASDDPAGYHAHAPNTVDDNGTITPSAAISSIVYTPEASIGVIRHLLTTYGEKVWGPMGFFDAFNESQNWFADSYLAIDQGPIICMIENHRSSLLWNHFMNNREIIEALSRIGFVRDSSTTASLQIDESKIRLYPNPTDDYLVIEGDHLRQFRGQISLKDQNGRVVTDWLIKEPLELERLEIPQKIPSGIYLISCQSASRTTVKKLMITHD